MGQNAPRSPKFIVEPHSVYHEKSQSYFTAHQLADYRRCPLLHRQKHAGLIPTTLHEFYRIGSALHTLVLEGREQFQLDWIVGGPINEKTGRCYGEDTKAYATWAEQQTKSVLSDSQYALVCHMANSVWSHGLAMTILDSGTPEGVLRDAYCGIECQIRCDWFSSVGIFTSDGPDGVLADLKTIGNLDDFPESAAAFSYVEQMAFYRAMIRQEIGRTVPVYMIAVEKQPPYRCGVWRISKDKLAVAEGINVQAMEDYAYSLKNDFWPTRYEDLKTL